MIDVPRNHLLTVPIPRTRAFIGALLLAALAAGYGLALADGRLSVSPSIQGISRTSGQTRGVDVAPSNRAAGSIPYAPQRVAAKSFASAQSRSSHRSSNNGLPSNIIRTGYLTLRVGHNQAPQAEQRVTAVANRLGGYVSSLSRVSQNSYITLVMRIPVGNFGTAFQRLQYVGRIQSESTNSQDVSLQVVDLGARLSALDIQRNQLLKLFGQAQTVADTIRVQQVLSGVQSQIEQTQARMRYLANRTALATITLYLESKAKVVVPVHHTTNPIIKALGSAGNAIISVIAGAIIVVGYALPLAGLFLMGYAAFILVRRAYWLRRKPSTRPA